jgi:hypothetical protein
VADFRETKHLLGKLHGYECFRYVRNAFAREFHAISDKEQQWDMFIGQFRGNSPGDYTRVRNLLVQRLQAGSVPDAFDEKLAKRIKDYLIGEAARENDFAEEDIDEDTEFKLIRDARLLASIAAFRRQELALPASSDVTILSSSSALRRASHRFREEFSGDTQVVLSRGGFAYLLSMIPTAQLGVDSLRRALFDFGRTGKLRDTERRALRLIKSAGDRDISWAERRLLSSQLKKSMQEEASRLGVSPEQINNSIKTGENAETVARVIVDALTNLSKDQKDVEKLKAAERRIVELQAELELTLDVLRQVKTPK